ncbi:MAG: AraC family transcriptional regulator [Bacteroidota bacterium]|nr:AraC family transcriptional regulator [Bacteroidota bacterium]MDP4204457.1 AraC family transcriptional regulator [Bacteroidota bacterium]
MHTLNYSKKLHVDRFNPMLIKQFNNSIFDISLSKHPEYVIILAIKENRKKIASISENPFTNGFLVLTDEDTFHFWKNSTCKKDNNVPMFQETFIIHFHDNLFPANYKEINEFQPISNVLNNASRGIRVIGDSYQLISEKIYNLTQENGINRIIQLYEILDRIGKTEEKIFIGPVCFKSNKAISSKGEILKHIDTYLHNNYLNDISLNEIAKVANMSVSSVCRFFKSKMHKNVFEYLNEIRIAHACRLMINPDLTIAQICYLSGYNSLSNFNNQFKKVIAQSPREFRSSLIND